MPFRMNIFKYSSAPQWTIRFGPKTGQIYGLTTAPGGHSSGDNSDGVEPDGGLSVDGYSLDGPSLDGPSLDGDSVEGCALDGACNIKTNELY
jgi:hypothetical protein